jgi:lysophospholipase L1-like esterase
VVVVMLGTNDTKPTNWERAGEFEGDLKNLIGDVPGAGKPSPGSICATPPPAFPGGVGIDDGRLRDGVRPKVLAVGRELGLPVVDVYAALAARRSAPRPGHPDAAGARVIADAVYDALTAGQNDPSTRLPRSSVYTRSGRDIGAAFPLPTPPMGSNRIGRVGHLRGGGPVAVGAFQ